MKKILVFVLSMLLVPNLFAQNFTEGKNYEVLPTTASEKPVVEEFFSFYCGHCNSFEPIIAQLKKELPPGVELKKNHVPFIGGEMGREMQLAYIASLMLEKQDKITPSIFDAIHHQKQRIDSRDKVKAIFAANGIDAKQFDASVSSFVAAGMADEMDKKTLAYQIKGVPAVVVNGKYKVNSGSVKSIAEYNALVNYLLTLK